MQPDTPHNDIVGEAKWHLTTLPPHVKARYSTDLIEKLVEEVERLRGIIGTYANVCQASEREIKSLKDKLTSGRIVHIAHTAED